MENKSTQQILADNLYAIRKKYGLSRSKTARLLHIGAGNLDALEAGNLPERLIHKFLFYIEKEFGIRPYDFLDETFREKLLKDTLPDDLSDSNHCGTYK